MALPASTGQRFKHNATTNIARPSETSRDSGGPTLTVSEAAAGSAYTLYGGRDVLGVIDCDRDCEGEPVCDGVRACDRELDTLGVAVVLGVTVCVPVCECDCDWLPLKDWLALCVWLLLRAWVALCVWLLLWD
jgi:hypothetical protein